MRKNFHESKERVGSGRTGQYSNMVEKKKKNRKSPLFYHQFPLKLGSRKFGQEE